MMIVDDFQKLIENNASLFSDDELGLFRDSVRCFHAAIFRPAYIMAYQGMMIFFRRQILNAKMPAGYDLGKWTGVQARLSRDKEWEEEVNNAIRTQPDPNKTPPTIALLCMSDTLRKDFDFWRNRRNDCAHYKDYNINNSHVLAFYSFLTQYLLKISVEGGKASLLNEFKDACDPTKTSPKESLQPLVNKILTMVRPEEMNDFFTELLSVMDFNNYDKYVDLLANIINSGNMELKVYAIEFVKKKMFPIGTDLINNHPILVGNLIGKSEAREYWMRYLERSGNRVAILAHMIMVGLVVPAEQDEAILKVLEYSFNKNEGMGEVSYEELQALKSVGFFKALKEKYLNGDYTSKNAINCGKYKHQFFYGYIYEYVKHSSIDKDFVEMMVDIFNRHVYPTVWLAIFKEHFLVKDEFNVQFNNVANENGIILPECLRLSSLPIN